MLKQLIVITLLIFTLPSYAEFDFSSVSDIEKLESENKEKQRLKALAQEAQRQLEIEKKQRAKANVQRRIYADKRKDKKRDQDYQDKLREVNLQSYTEKKADKERDQAYQDKLRELELKTLTARANRTEDVINAELEREKAKTDMVQAAADQKRMKGAAEIIRAENPQDIDNLTITIKE